MYVNVKNHEDDEVIDGSKQANVLWKLHID